MTLELHLRENETVTPMALVDAFIQRVDKEAFRSSLMNEDHDQASISELEYVAKLISAEVERRKEHLLHQDEF